MGWLRLLQCWDTPPAMHAVCVPAALAVITSDGCLGADACFGADAAGCTAALKGAKLSRLGAGDAPSLLVCWRHYIIGGDMYAHIKPKCRTCTTC